MSKKGNVRILVVDDEESIRRMLRLCLEGAGYRVTLASSGEAAVAAAGTGTLFLDEVGDLPHDRKRERYGLKG